MDKSSGFAPHDEGQLAEHLVDEVASEATRHELLEIANDYRHQNGQSLAGIRASLRKVKRALAKWRKATRRKAVLRTRRGGGRGKRHPAA